MIKAIQEEDRKSFAVDASRLRMTDDGRIYTEGKSSAGAFPIEPDGVMPQGAKGAQIAPRPAAQIKNRLAGFCCHGRGQKHGVNACAVSFDRLQQRHLATQKRVAAKVGGVKAVS